MKTHTASFKQNIVKLGKQLNSKIVYKLNSETVELGKAQLNSITPHYESSILKSVMKELEIDSNVEIPVGVVVNYQFGLKINNEYEYLNFGNYIVKEIEKQEDTDSWLIKCCDKMLYSMKNYENMNITYPITIRDYINAICQYLGLTFKNISDTFTNYDKQIQKELYLSYNEDKEEWESLGYTFRDVLDELAQVVAGCICINENDDELEIRYPQSVGEYETKEGSSITIPNCDDSSNLNLQLQGDTYQQTYSGKNLLNYNVSSNTVNGITYTINSDKTISVRGTASADSSFNLFTNNFNLPIGTYTLSGCPAGGGDGTYYLATNLTGSTIKDTGNGITFTLTSGNTNRSIWLHVLSGQSVNLTFKPMLEQGSQATPYEPYVGGQPSPNPDYPQEIEVVTGRQDVLVCGKNLYNANDTTYYSSCTYVSGINTDQYTIRATGTDVIINSQVSAGSSYSSSAGTLIPCKYGETIYYDTGNSNFTKNLITQYNSNKVSLGYTNTGSSSGSYTPTNSDCEYISIRIGYGNATNGTEYTLAPIIAKGSTATEYQAYQGNIREINLGKNLFDVNVIQEREHNGVTMTFNGQTIHLEGTTTGNANFYMKSGASFTLQAGTYFITRSTIAPATLALFSNNVPIVAQGNSDISFTLSQDTKIDGLTFQVASGVGQINKDVTIQIEKGSSKSSYAPYKTPIELCKIDNYQDSIKKATGKNLFDKSNATTINGYAAVTTITSDNNMRSVYMACEPNTTYTISKIKSARFKVSLTNSTVEPTIGTSVSDDIQNNDATSITITTKSNTTYIVVWYYYSTYDTLTQQQILDTIQIEKGSQATDFEPYGTNWYIEKKIGKVVLDGSEDWQTNTFYTDCSLFNLSYSSAFVPTDFTQIYIMSDYFTGASRNLCASNDGKNTCALGNANPRIWINIENEIVGSSNQLTNFKTWLSTHNTEVYYVLATPTYEIITDTELIGELEDIELLEGVNNIDVDSENLPSPIKLTYLAEMDTIDEEYLRDVNVNFGEKFGPVNSVVLSRSSGTDNIYEKDNASVEENGLCELKIADNQILNWDDRDTYLAGIFNKLNGLQYYTNDFVSTGIGYYNLLDIYKIKIGNNTYKCIMLNDEFNVTQGLEENVYAKKMETGETNYTKADKTDRRLNQATLEIDKQNSRIKGVAKTITLTTTDNGNSAGIKIQLLNEDGQQIGNDYDADIEMTGKVSFTDLSTSNPTTTIINGDNITTGNIKSANYVADTSGTKINLTDGTIDSKYFKVSSTGVITASSGTIGGWNMDSVCLSKTIGNYSFEIRSDRAYNQPALLVYDTVNRWYNFYVQPNGYLFARTGEFRGTVTGGAINIGNTNNYLRMGADWTTNPEVSGLTITGSGGLDMGGNGINNLSTINLNGGGTGQTDTVYVTTKFSAGSNYVDWYRGALSFKNGIYIGYSEEGPYRQYFN